ncbi:GNAT family N-acetyltransferase [Clostridium sp. C8]|jgi:ElaA protein|uniref:GNAT family N-acetyltransferase n=1 Tax=Clostridium sp. C8 TaxID=1667357 RepID=UPI00062E772E|nr:GNAT family N-acetyltransferase [Clostridium sp. C8]KLE17547.1 GNAT family acetyltransferase [Clostridium sp. C8]
MKKEFEFRLKYFDELNINELYDIVKVRYEVFVCDQKITSENDFDDKDKECYHLTVYYKDTLVGYCRILKAGMSYKEPSIGRVLVLKDYRRNNIAQEMMKRAVDFIINELGENKITLSAQLYVKGLYESIGFKVISDIYEEAEIPHIKMSFSKA